METKPFLSRLGLRVSRRKRSDQLSARVRRVLVHTLYTQPASLALGALAGVTATGVSAWVSGIEQLWVGFALLTLVAIARLALASRLSPSAERKSIDRLEMIYEIGAFTYALILGMIAAITMWLDAGAEVRFMMVANALCYGVGVSARIAGRPTIAMGQLLLVCLPIVAATIAIGTLTSLTLLLTIAFLIPAMASIALNIFKVLRESISAAETSSQLADKMQTLARTDVVTGLSNRAGLNHAMVETMMARETSSQFALFWIDLDRFKEVNDLLGHPVGDRVRSKSAGACRKCARKRQPCRALAGMSSSSFARSPLARTLSAFPAKSTPKLCALFGSTRIGLKCALRSVSRCCLRTGRTRTR